jgi:hypothetical protein
VFPYPIVYDKDWSVVASGVTISSSSISRLDCVSGIVDFGSAITGGSVYLNAYTYKVGSQSGVAVTQARTISRAPSRNLRDVTPYGSQYRQRLAGRPEVSWTLDFLAGDPDVDVMHRMLAGGKTNLMYLLSHKVAMADASSVTASYIAHCLVDSVEVTGKVDGLIEGVLGLKVTPQDDVLRRTRIYEEIDVSSRGRVYTLGPAAVGATAPSTTPVPFFGFGKTQIDTIKGGAPVSIVGTVLPNIAGGYFIGTIYTPTLGGITVQPDGDILIQSYASYAAVDLIAALDRATKTDITLVVRAKIIDKPWVGAGMGGVNNITSPSILLDSGAADEPKLQGGSTFTGYVDTTRHTYIFRFSSSGSTLAILGGSSIALNNWDKTADPTGTVRMGNLSGIGNGARTAVSMCLAFDGTLTDDQVTAVVAAYCDPTL